MSTKVLAAFGEDLTHLLELGEADLESCVRDAAEVNLGVRFEEPDTIMMFKDGSSTPDLSALASDKKNAKGYLQALMKAMEGFTEADFVAALEAMEEDGASTRGVLE